MAERNAHWNLESFVDALSLELDRARENLAVKSVNKPLTYAVKDLSLDLQVFPTFDGDVVRFVTAQPGEAGSSKIQLQLGSITDQQVRATTKRVTMKDDLSLDDLDEIPEDTKKALRKAGVRTARDFEEVEKQNIDLGRAGNKKVNYKDLAGMIQKARRGETAPGVDGVSFSMSATGEPILKLSGKNLAMHRQFSPVVALNGQLAEVLEAGANEIRVSIGKTGLQPGPNDLVLTLDPFAVCRLNLNIPTA